MSKTGRHFNSHGKYVAASARCLLLETQERQAEELRKLDLTWQKAPAKEPDRIKAGRPPYER